MIGVVERQLPTPRQPFTLAAMSTVTSWIPVAHLWEKFDFNPFTGQLILKRTGTPITLRGRAQIQFGYRGDKIVTSAGRAIYAWCTGAWPEPTVDHIDRNPFNNRFWNLRPATYREQVQNTRAFKGGIEETPQGWRVRPLINGKRTNCGSFATKAEAQKAYVIATGAVA